jgi:hypothetical protein
MTTTAALIALTGALSYERVAANESDTALAQAPTTDGYSRAVISRIRTPSASTYHSPMIILIASVPSALG